MGLKVTNNAFGTLNAGINSSATTIVLAAGQGARFPSLSAGDYFYATLIDTSNNLEIVKVTARSTDTMTVVRGQDSTTARAFSTNDRFELRPTAALFNEKANDADVAATYLPLAGGTLTNDLSISKNQAARTSLKVLNGNTNSAADAAWDLFTANGNWVGVARRNGGFDIIKPDSNVGWRIDNAGRITAPYQPHFRVNQPNAATNANVTFGAVSDNVGSHWSTSTNLFTAPLAGVYVFSWDGLHSNSSPYYARVLFKINGSQNTSYGDSLEDWNGSYHSSHLTLVIKLAANDTVGLFNEGTPLYNTGNYGSFSGFLLG